MRALLLSLLVLLAPAVRAQACDPARPSWVCPGLLELRDDAKALVARMQWWQSGELLAELEKDGQRRRYLVPLPAQRALYEGVSLAELAVPGRNPFAFLDMAFALPLGALRSAYPEGPQTVPAGESSRDLQLERRPYRLVTLRQDAPLRIQYRVEAIGRAAVVGHWEAERATPWPASQALEGWITEDGAPAAATLEQARQAR